jgi:pyruvate carboxylase
VVHGVVTNIDFLKAVLSHSDFMNGNVTTRWVETEFDWKPISEPDVEHLVAASLADISVSGVRSQVSGQDEVDPYSPWKVASGFRN